MRTGELVRSVKHSVAGPRCAEKRANQTVETPVRMYHVRGVCLFLFNRFFQNLVHADFSINEMTVT